MRNRQLNKLSMYRTIEKILSDNPALVNTIPALAATKNNFSQKIQAIATASGQQQSVTTGITTDKKLLKRTLVENVLIIAGALNAYASQTNNNQLLDDVNHSRTKLLETRNEQLAPLCQTIHGHAVAHLSALAAFDITSLHLSTLQTHINNYRAKSQEPRIAVVAKKTATGVMARTFAQTDKLLRYEMDKLILWFKKSEPDFFNTYTGARQIINLGITHTSLRVVVKNIQGNHLTGAAVSLLQNNRVIYTKTTNERGIVSISRISPDVYDIRIEQAGFKSFFQSQITFASGKRVMRKVQLLR